MLGNSFSHYDERTTSTELREHARYISLVLELELVQEKTIDNTFVPDAVFNDTALHWFPGNKLQTLDSAKWLDRPEPVRTPGGSELIHG